MGTPTKRRKLNDTSKSSPVAPRNLDYFFGKQKRNIPPNKDEQKAEGSGNSSELNDEQLARKLQAEWDQEAAASSVAAKETTDQSPAIAENTEGPEEVQKDKILNANGYHKDELGEGSSDVQTEPQPAQVKGKNTLSLQSTGSEEDTITSNIPFDDSPLTFEPAKYVSELQSHWAAESGNSSYALLTRCFVLVNGTQSRIKIVDTLVNLLRVIIEGDPSSLLPTVRHVFKYIAF